MSIKKKNPFEALVPCVFQTLTLISISSMMMEIFFYGGKQSIGMGLLDTSLYHRYLTGPGLGKKLNYSFSLKHFLWKLKLHQAKQAKCAGHYKIWPKGLLCYFLSYMSFPWSYPIIKISSWELLSLCHPLQQTHVVTKFPMFPWVHSSRDSTI